jgi:RNA-binding protein
MVDEFIMNTAVKQALKAQAHHLKPVVMIGSKGLTSGVIEETKVAILAHELIKVKIAGLDKAERQAIAASLCQEIEAELVQLIGTIAILYKKNEDKMKG